MAARRVDRLWSAPLKRLEWTSRGGGNCCSLEEAQSKVPFIVEAEVISTGSQWRRRKPVWVQLCICPDAETEHSELIPHGGGGNEKMFGCLSLQSWPLLFSFCVQPQHVSILLFFFGGGELPPPHPHAYIMRRTTLIHFDTVNVLDTRFFKWSMSHITEFYAGFYMSEIPGKFILNLNVLARTQLQLQFIY